MKDVVVVASVLAFFALCVAYVALCDRIAGPDGAEPEDAGPDGAEPEDAVDRDEEATS